MKIIAANAPMKRAELMLFVESLFPDKSSNSRINQANAFGNDDPACSGIGASDDQAEDQRNGTHHDHDYVFIRLPSTNQPYNTGNHQHQSNDDVQKCIKGSGIGNDPKANAKQSKAAKQVDDGVLAAALLLPPAQDAGNGSDDQANGHDNIQGILDNFLSDNQH